MIKKNNVNNSQRKVFGAMIKLGTKTKGKSFEGAIKKQAGFGLLGLFTGAFLLIFFSVMTVSLFPLYLENFSVRSCLTSLSNDENVLAKDKDKIKTALLKRFSVSNVSSVSRDNISIDKSPSRIKINVDYAVQAKFINNVDFIVHFDEQKEINL